VCGVSIGSKTWVVGLGKSRSCTGGGHLPGAGRPHRPEPPPSSGRGEIGEYSIPGSDRYGHQPFHAEQTTTSTTSTALTRSRWPGGNTELRLKWSAFAPRPRGEIVLADPSTRADLELTLLSRTQQAARPQQQRRQRLELVEDFKVWPCCTGWPTPTPATPAGPDRAFRNARPGIAPDVATESVIVFGQRLGRSMFGMSTDDSTEDARGREQGGI